MSQVVLKRVGVMMNRVFSGRTLLMANTMSNCVLMGLGDVFMQRIEALSLDRHAQHDWKRTGRMAVIGFVLGPFNHVWYTFLDKLLPGVSVSIVARKIVADQVVASPFFALTFFMGMGSLEGQRPKQSWDEFRSKFWGVYKADWCFWPPAQAINFTFVSPRFRVLYVAGATLIWDSFLSYSKHKDHKSTPPGVQALQDDTISAPPKSIPSTTLTTTSKVPAG